MARDALQVKAGLDVRWNESWAATVNYAGEFRQTSTAHSVYAGLKWSF